uniref:Peptidase S1 domain-containing protein n=1 Tax=Salvator merianae TaxID=96440 RepID=A0A8D0BCH8_SALMN
MPHRVSQDWVQRTLIQHHRPSAGIPGPTGASRGPRCGQPAYFSRIVGGQSAADGSWPWQVSILKNSEHHCGGSLIDKQWVLSAAHCFYSDTTISQYKVILGAYQLSNPSSHAFTSSVKQIIIHPDSNGEATSGNDIALLKLTFPVHFTNYIMPICLPNSSVQFFTNVDCWITGWGDTQPDVPLKPPQTLQEVRVPLLNQSSCNELYNAISLLDKDPIKPDMLCAGFPEGGKDACQRDSGGPLVCKCNEHWILAGAVSWGIGCALPNLPGVYISVPYYANWIHEEIPEMNFSLRLLLLLLLLTHVRAKDLQHLRKLLLILPPQSPPFSSYSR